MRGIRAILEFLPKIDIDTLGFALTNDVCIVEVEKGPQGLPCGLLVLETHPSSEEVPMSCFRLPVRQKPVYDPLVYSNWESLGGGLVVVEW